MECINVTVSIIQRVWNVNVVHRSTTIVHGHERHQKTPMNVLVRLLLSFWFPTWINHNNNKDTTLNIFFNWFPFSPSHLQSNSDWIKKHANVITTQISVDSMAICTSWVVWGDRVVFVWIANTTRPVDIVTIANKVSIVIVISISKVFMHVKVKKEKKSLF